METLQRTANRGSVSTGYNITNSVKLEVDNNEWLYRNSPTAGNRKTFTLSLWLKRAVLGHKPAGDDEYIAGQGSDARYHFAGDTLRFMFESSSTELESSRVYRDPSAWYHIVLAVDTTQGTAADRVKFYINGVQGAWSNTKYPDQDAEGDWMNTDDLYIGTKWASNDSGEGDNDLSGYLSEVVLLDGTAASPTSFGEFDEDSGIWKPIDVSDLTFGDEGFYLNFDNSSSLGADSSGNSNTLTLSNIAAADQATDTPTNNFCILSPLWAFTIGTAISEGGTKSVADASVSGWQPAKGSIAVNNGKWYWEYSGYTAVNTFIGVQNSDISLVYGSSYSVMLSASDDLIYFNDPSNRNEAFSTTIATTDVWAVALNMDDGEISFYRNGSLENSAVALDGLVGQGPFAPMVVQYSTNTNMYLNFGGYTADTPSSAASDANGYGAFEYAPPSGYYAICTKNLARFG